MSPWTKYRSLWEKINFFHFVNRFEVIAYADRPCEYVLYDDDGYTTDYDKPEHFDSIAIKEDVNGKFVVFSNKQIVKVSLFN